MAAPQLTGKRPSQVPCATLTAGVDLSLPHDVLWTASLRYESNRWTGDANTMRLGSAVVVGSRLSWAMNYAVSFVVAADNLLNTRVATTQTADGVFSYDAPRIVTAGIELKS